MTNGGHEYNLTLIGLSLALTEVGPGTPSVDDALFPGFTGTKLAVLALAAAAAGSYLATSERFNRAAPATQEGEADQLASDPATGEPGRKFTREESPTPAAEIL